MKFIVLRFADTVKGFDAYMCIANSRSHAVAIMRQNKLFKNVELAE